jgi:hypothetical protein
MAHTHQLIPEIGKYVRRRIITLANDLTLRSICLFRRKSGYGRLLSRKMLKFRLCGRLPSGLADIQNPAIEDSTQSGPCHPKPAIRPHLTAGRIVPLRQSFFTQLVPNGALLTICEVGLMTVLSDLVSLPLRRLVLIGSIGEIR